MTQLGCSSFPRVASAFSLPITVKGNTLLPAVQDKCLGESLLIPHPNQQQTLLAFPSQQTQNMPTLILPTAATLAQATLPSHLGAS